jgi:hypothetical protein
VTINAFSARGDKAAATHAFAAVLHFAHKNSGKQRRNSGRFAVFPLAETSAAQDF